MITRFTLPSCAVVFLAVFASFADAQTTGALLLPKLFAPKIYFAGVFDFDQTLVIPRQRLIPRLQDKSATGVPAPAFAAEPSFPGGSLRGEDEFGTVFRFAPTVRGCLIKTEGFGEGNVSGYWNENNKQGDQTLRANLCSSARDFSVDGRADLRGTPWSYTKWFPKPDPHGPDCPQRANGLCAEGSGFVGSRLRFFQIPGTAIVLKGGRGEQAGAGGIYDNPLNQLSDIFVSSAINGIDADVTDAKLSHIYITGIVKDGLIVHGSGTVIDGDHVWGADRAAVFYATATASQCYHEAARIGTHIMGNAHGTRINGLNIGPATCWERGVKIESHGCEIEGLIGSIRLQSEEHPDIAGVEILPGLVHTVIGGSLVIDANAQSPEGKATGLILRGHRSKVDLRGGWNAPCQGTFVRVAEGITGSSVEIRGRGEAGTVLDLSASGLDHINGEGNEFKVNWSGSAARVIYPGGGNTYNLAPGTQLWVDGVLQSGKMRKTAPIK